MGTLSFSLETLEVFYSTGSKKSASRNRLEPFFRSLRPFFSGAQKIRGQRPRFRQKLRTRNQKLSHMKKLVETFEGILWGSYRLECCPMIWWRSWKVLFRNRGPRFGGTSGRSRTLRWMRRAAANEAEARVSSWVRLWPEKRFGNRRISDARLSTNKRFPLG